MPKMSSDTGPKFTSLKQERAKTKPMEAAMLSYPKLYLDKAIPGISETDIGKKLRAEIKIIPTSINRNKHNGKESVSFHVEVTDIRVL